MLLTTLVHLAIASIAVVLWIGRSGRLADWRRQCAARLEGDASARSEGALFLWAASWTGILAPVLLLWLAWLWVSALWDLNLLDHLLDWLHALAQAIDLCMPSLP